MPLLVVFIVVPLIEIGLFIKVGGWIGLWPTLAIVLLTAIVGTTLMRWQGLSTLSRLQDNVKFGQDPTDAMAHGALILVAGMLLLTPGFFTDAVGLSLLIPQVRAAAISRAARTLKGKMTVMAAGPNGPVYDDVIDADFEHVDNENTQPSGWTKKP